MELLFPENFISGSIKNDQEADGAFKQYPNFSRAYIMIALGKPDLRKWYEDKWLKLYKYLDKDFTTRFQNEQEHLSREWEFHLVSVLLDRGITLKEKNWEIGPDFCIETDIGKKIWIEAIACDLGEKDKDSVEPMPEMKPGVLYSFGGNIEETDRPRALRITNAIATKFEKYKNYLSNPKSGVSENDCLVIAVNGEAIQHFSVPRMVFKRAVFGQGPDVLVKKPGLEKLQGGYYKPLLTIVKEVGDKKIEIPANFMELEEFSIISAVIYSGNSISNSWLNGYKPGDDFIFAYHSNPNNPVPDGLFKFGRGVRKNGESGAIEEKEQLRSPDERDRLQKFLHL